MMMLHKVGNCDRVSRFFGGGEGECQAKISSSISFLGPAVNKRITHFRNAVSVTERLAVKLRSLATGDSYHSMVYLFKVPTQQYR